MEKLCVELIDCIKNKSQMEEQSIFPIYSCGASHSLLSMDTVHFLLAEINFFPQMRQLGI